jgi:hypothetical protein
VSGNKSSFRKKLFPVYLELEGVSAFLERGMGQIVRFSMAEMFDGQNHPFQHGSWSKSSVSVCLEMS